MLELLDLVKFLSEKISDWNELEHKKLETLYETVVEKSFLKLEIINKDYQTQLSTLKYNLENRSLPPRELLQWLRTVGLEHRDKRESLQVIDTELERLNDKIVNQNKDKKSKFYGHFGEYIKSVLDYMEATRMQTNQPTFYRSFEKELENLLSTIEEQQSSQSNSDTIANLFYNSPFVRDVLRTEIIRVCDEDLPNRWKEVNRQYKLVFASFQEL